MKARRPQLPERDVVEEIVEDLGQQDVLPSTTEPDVMTSSDAEMMAEEQAGKWDEPVGGQGRQAPRTAMEDEVKASEALVERGVNEAGEELRDLDANEIPPEEAEEAE